MLFLSPKGNRFFSHEFTTSYNVEGSVAGPEARPDLGDQVIVAKRAPWLHTVGDIAFWLEQEVYRLGLDVRTNTYFDAEDVLADKPDYVVVATGAIARSDGI
jgi:hypothetical protein